MQRQKLEIFRAGDSAHSPASRGYGPVPPPSMIVCLIVLFLPNRGSKQYVNLTLQVRATIVGPVDRSCQLHEAGTKLTFTVGGSNLILDLPQRVEHDPQRARQQVKLLALRQLLVAEGRERVMHHARRLQEQRFSKRVRLH